MKINAPRLSKRVRHMHESDDLEHDAFQDDKACPHLKELSPAATPIADTWTPATARERPGLATLTAEGRRLHAGREERTGTTLRRRGGPMGGDQEN